jgi:phage terminase large subunit-like protein
VFPNGTNDDMVDTMSQAINRLTGSAPQLMML